MRHAAPTIEPTLIAAMFIVEREGDDSDRTPAGGIAADVEAVVGLGEAEMTAVSSVVVGGVVIVTGLSAIPVWVADAWTDEVVGARRDRV
jgi:hypothetical protein